MSEILTQKRGDVLHLTLNRPEKGNSLNEPLLEKLSGAIRGAASDPNLKALVLSGAGDRFFCTGADLSALADAGKTPDRILSLFNETSTLLRSFPTLTASFVGGDCVGGGLGIALSTDFVLASEHARFGTPEITRGLFPYVISAPLVDKLGEQGAKALCFGGRLWTALEAWHYGAISELVERDQYGPRSQELIDLWNRVAVATLRRGKACLAPQSRPSPETLVQYLRDAVQLFRSRP